MLVLMLIRLCENVVSQVVESEKTAKWQYTRHCEDLTVEIKKLREEVSNEYEAGEECSD